MVMWLFTKVRAGRVLGSSYAGSCTALVYLKSLEIGRQVRSARLLRYLRVLCRLPQVSIAHHLPVRLLEWS